MHDLQRTDICTLWQSFTNLKESMYNDQRKTFIQHVSDAKGSSGWSACTIGTERVVLCDSLLYLQRIFQDTSYVCRPGCFSGLVHKGRQLCSLLSTSCQSSGWFACPNIRLKCTCDRFSRFTKTPGQLMCPAGKATYSPFHSFLQNTLKVETQGVSFKRWWQLCMICKELRIVLCDSHFPTWRSPCTTIKGRHSYSMFQMQRAALDGLHAQQVLRESCSVTIYCICRGFFKTLAMFVSQAASQVWYTKADRYAACFQRPARALDGLHAQISDWNVLATVSADSQKPQDSWCALQARLRISPFILSCRNILKAETQAVCFKRWWQLCMICKELTFVLCVSHFPT